MENEFYRHYKDRVVPALRERHKYKNVHQIPRVHKVVINTSVGSQPDIKQALDEAKMELALITGQQPAETRSKKSIANFKLRKDQIIGAKVTLRGDRCFDGNGNYTLGVPDQTIFPEIEMDKIKRNIGFDVTIVTTARTDEEAKSLLSELGMPFSDRAKKLATASPSEGGPAGQEQAA